MNDDISTDTSAMIIEKIVHLIAWCSVVRRRTPNSDSFVSIDHDIARAHLMIYMPNPSRNDLEHVYARLAEDVQQLNDVAVAQQRLERAQNKLNCAMDRILSRDPPHTCT